MHIQCACLAHLPSSSSLLRFFFFSLCSFLPCDFRTFFSALAFFSFFAAFFADDEEDELLLDEPPIARGRVPRTRSQKQLGQKMGTFFCLLVLSLARARRPLPQRVAPSGRVGRCRRTRGRYATAGG